MSRLDKESLAFLDEWWPKALPIIEKAATVLNGTHTADDIRAGIENCEYHLWPGERSFVLTQIIIYPRKKALHIFLAGGDLSEIMPRKQQMEDWARVQGCNLLQAVGRKGWDKFCPDWSGDYIFRTKEL